MAGCYECHHCGKCTMSEPPVLELRLVCSDCGREIQPGESADRCASCNSDRFEYRQGTNYYH